ncbi:hypothetical protein RAS1_16990 [Phycisphaerae bacterium RAS1]|nr:hypothetical protein RAS1_16990 [Phycisphaerae bacterium RAS1]
MLNRSSADLRRLFGDALVLYDRSDDGATRGVIFFRPPIPPPKPMMSAIVAGWHLRVTFDENSLLVNYELSDVHKPRFQN